MSDDAQLLRRYASDRSEEAFSALVQRHLPLVYQSALRRTNGQAQLAEDVAQTVFLALAKGAGRLEGHTVLAGWLYVATRHAAANALRGEQRRQRREQEAWAMNEVSAPEIAAAEWERLRPELDSVMDELGEEDRVAVLLRYFQNRPYAEIGATLRLSEDAARRRVDRALEKLRSLLARRGITSTAAALGGLMVAQSAVAAPAGLATAVTGSVLAGAGVAATATGTAGFIAFMTTNKIVMGIAGVVTLVAGGTAVYEFGQALQANAALAAMRGDGDRLRAQLAQEATKARESSSRTREAELQVSALRQRLEELEGAQNVGREPSNSEVQAAPKPAIVSFAGKMNVLYASPEYIELKLKEGAANARLQYGPMYQKLGLSEGQIREFEGLLQERLQAVFDTFAAAIKSGVSVDDPKLGQMAEPNQVVIEDKLRALLGPSGYPEMAAIATAAGARPTVEGLASNLYYTTEPLTAEQGRRLSRLIADNLPKPSSSSMVQGVPGPDWPAIYARASDFLSERQLSTLRTSNERMEVEMQLSLLSDRLLQEAATQPEK